MSTAETPTAAHAARRGPHGAGRRPRDMVVALIAPVLLALMAVVGVLAQVPENTGLSPIDEWVYVDYLAKVPTQGVVTQGEATGDEAREAIACRGVDMALPVNAPLCAEVQAGTDRSSEFPMKGITSADIYTPLYFWTTSVMARAFSLVGVEDLVVAGSAAGAIWLAAAMVFLWAAMRRFRIPAPLIVGLGALLLATPVMYWTYTYISTDAPTMLVAAVLLWLVARVTSGSGGRIAFVVVSVVGVLFKVQNILAVGALGLALAAWALAAAWEHRGEFAGRAGWLWRTLVSRNVLTAVVSVVLGVVAQAVWLSVRTAIATGPSPDQGVGTRLSLYNFVGESVKFLTGSAGDPTSLLREGWGFAAGTLVGWLAVLGTLGLVVFGGRTLAETWLGRAAFVGALVAGPLLAVGVELTAGYYFQLPTRYGLSLLPMFLTSAGLVLLRKRWLTWVVLVAGFVCWFGVLLH